jgi:hypothetical protein
VVTGCPVGQTYTNIAALEAEQGHPYRFAEEVDQAGNQDGYICARQLTDAEIAARFGPDFPFVLFVFLDNTNPASAHAHAG